MSKISNTDYKVNITLSGTRNKGGPTPGQRQKISGYVTDEDAYVVAALIQILSYGPGSLPGEKREETLKAFGKVLGEIFFREEDHERFALDFKTFMEGGLYEGSGR